MTNATISSVLVAQLCLSTVAAVALAAADDHGGFVPDVLGLALDVPDVEQAARFYQTALGFEVEGVISADRGARLSNGGVLLSLRRSEAAPQQDGAAKTYFNFQVRDAVDAARAARDAGASVSSMEPRTTPVGPAIALFDPAGHPSNLIHADDRPTPDRAASVFNIGISVRELSVAEEFFARLDCAPFSREWLPATLPLERHGRAALVLHAKASSDSDPAARASSLLLAVPDLDAACAALRERGIALDATKKRATPAGRAVAFAGPSGVRIELVERSPARLAFERFQSLAGTWSGASTAGWRDAQRFDVIAGGSVVLSTSQFDAHPGESMLTAVHMDGARLLLTHYCVAGNQPRLVATSFENDGNRITFTFLDATGIASRDEGHMDQVVYDFRDAEHFSSRWSWYQAGRESWFEEIALERKR